MYKIQDSTLTRQILAATDACGANLPKPVRDALERRADHRATVSNLTRPRDLARAVLAALDAGKDPAADETVQRGLAAVQVAGMRDTLLSELDADVTETMRANADKIIGAWSKGFNALSATLSTAFTQIGDFDLDDTRSVLSRGGDAADTWTKTRDAVARVEKAMTGWAALMDLTHLASLNGEHRPLRYAELSLEQFRAVPRKAGPWKLLSAGATLSLPTAAQYRDRVAAVEDAIRAEAAAEELAALHAGARG